MTDHHFIQSAHWETGNRILVQLCEDWETDDRQPPLFLGPKPRPFSEIRRAPVSEFGRLAHYYIENSHLCFLLDPDLYPQWHLLDDEVYVAGTFNGWDPGGDDAQHWQMSARQLQERTFLICEVPLAELETARSDDAAPPQFKFRIRHDVWIPVSMNAPNRVTDGMGNENYEVRLHQTGRHVFHALLENGAQRRGGETLLWNDGQHREAIPIPSTLNLLRLESDLPLGAIVHEDATTFRLFAPRASRVEVCFAPEPGGEPRLVRLGETDSGVWETVVGEPLGGWCYWFHVRGRDQDGTTHFDPEFPILDPYALSAVGHRGPGIIVDSVPTPGARFEPRDWHDLVILECHLADLVDKSPYKENPDDPPRYRHLAAMLRDPHSYLRSLGVNAIQLQPLQQSDKRSPEEYHWGYMTANFFALEASYADDPLRASQLEEFREVMSAAHEAGIAVILDVVYNHVGEPAHLLFIDKFYYFRLDHLHELTNWSGCGNDLRCEAPMALRLIIDSLLHLVRTFDVDGFRFDLAELIGKPALEAIAVALKEEKPSLILIAEPWSFRGHIAKELMDTPYASWNDGYRDFVREYLRGKGNTEGLRYFLSGSRGHFASWPAQTVNYTESHDDHCWIDAITENDEHQGFNPTVADRRRTQLMVSLLMMSFGLPMLAEGQDFLRSKHGVSNTYQDGDLNALDYERLLYYTNTNRYFRHWIQFRLGTWGELLRLAAFPGESYLRFYEEANSTAALVLYNADQSLGPRQLIFAINPHVTPVSIRCPELRPDRFRQVADTERLNPEGLNSALLPIGKTTKRIPALSAYLWTSR